MQTSSIVELIAAALMVLGVIGVLLNRLQQDKGLGLRAIQFAALVLIVPALLILALEKVLNSETTATLFGAITGYMLSGIGDSEGGGKKKKDGHERDKEKTL